MKRTIHCNRHFYRWCEMDRVNLIYNHPQYRKLYTKLVLLEQSREFCNHNMTHFLDVARLMYIRVLEEDIRIGKFDIKVLKEIIYAIGLLHDIGRVEQIENGISHDVASAGLCEVILPECSFTEAETEIIKQAILHHRNSIWKDQQSDRSYLGQLLFWADKKSRKCYECKMTEACNWAETLKNKEIDY